MRIGVLLHVGLLVERLAAVGAVERTYVGVDQQVRAERRRATESLAARPARVRPVGTVLHPVSSQAGHVTERFVARATLERPLAGNVRPSRMNLYGYYRKNWVVAGINPTKLRSTGSIGCIITSCHAHWTWNRCNVMQIEEYLTLWRPMHCCHMTVALRSWLYATTTAIKHPVSDQVKPSFVIFDIRALWRSGLSIRVPGCQKLQMTA